MKRIVDDHKNIRKCFPLTWCKCISCGEEFKFERMWVAMCLDRGYDVNNYYCCRKCASHKEDVIRIFENNGINI
jgi:hypothetical protein